MTSKDRVASPSYTCDVCCKNYQHEKMAFDCCKPGIVSADSRLAAHLPYACGSCAKAYADFAHASECCKADHVNCPLSDLPDDAYLGQGMAYSYGKTFTGSWEMVLNHSSTADPVRVYPLPPLVAKMVEDIYRSRFQSGAEDVQKKLRAQLGIGQEGNYAQ